jgi:hypothetical protein
MGMSAPKAPLQLRRLDSVPPGSLGAFSRLDQEQDRGVRRPCDGRWTGADDEETGRALHVDGKRMTPDDLPAA